MHGLIDLFFPRRCAGCDCPGALLCDPCRAAARVIDSKNACPRCGAPHGRDGCFECRGRQFAFSSARCAALLEPPFSRAIVVLKDGGERRYAPVLAEMLAEAGHGWLTAQDVLVPVPAAPQAVARRGFDHALDITRALSVLSGISMVVALRSRASEDQRVLGRSARFSNREGAFRVASRARVPPRVVLVDDVFTTGATFNGAARVLRAAGASDVRALAVARACRPAPGKGVAEIRR